MSLIYAGGALKVLAQSPNYAGVLDEILYFSSRVLHQQDIFENVIVYSLSCVVINFCRYYSMIF